MTDGVLTGAATGATAGDAGALAGAVRMDVEDGMKGSVEEKLCMDMTRCT